jgi:hypothetical protein
VNVDITNDRQQVLGTAGNMSGDGLLMYFTESVTSMAESRSLYSMAIKANVFMYVSLRLRLKDETIPFSCSFNTPVLFSSLVCTNWSVAALNWP